MSHWAHPLLLNNDSFADSWSRPRDTPLLFVCGSGFDPRAVTVLRRLQEVARRRVDGWMIELPEQATDLDVRPLAEANRTEVERLIIELGGELHTQPLPDYNDSRSLGRLISRHFQESAVLDNYDEVLVEISALPRSVFFPLIRGILERAHRPPGEPQHWAGDLHVAVCENPEVDGHVLEEGTTAMAPIGGFAGEPGAQPKTTIWVPVLGERASARVRALYGELEPDETCPVLPWPARDPRRGDRLLLDYRQLLFEDIRLEPRNIIHAAERNPFDLYRTLGALHERYLASLRPLGSVGMVLSSHSSKLLSVGVLLTAYEHNLVVQHVSPGRYGLHDGADNLRDHDEIYDLWLTGEPYR
jgi:hypothetical protein